MTGIDALSYTTLKELERCGYRYYLERVLGLPEKGSALSGTEREGVGHARARGALVHRLLETVDFKRRRAPAAGEVARLARQLGLRLGAGEREEIAQLISGVIRGGDPAERVAGAERLYREHPFALALGAHQPLLNGVIDLLARERDGGAIVIDYKSERVEPGEDLEELVEREYSLQRMLYALAVLRDGAPRVEVFHWFLQRPRGWVLASYSNAEAPALQAQLSARLAAASEGAFAVSQRPHRGLCLTCPGRGGLCSWSEQQTLRVLPAEHTPQAPVAAGAKSA